MTFEQALRIAGLIPRDIVPDGRIRRCRTETHPNRRNGWYVLHPDGHGVWGDWASGSGSPTGTWRDEQAASQPPSAAAMESMRRRRAQEAYNRACAINDVRSFWRVCRPLYSVHPYIANKGLQPLGCAGLRIAQDGRLIVPVYQGDALMSLQAISADGDKRFWTGAPIQGGSYTLQRPRAAVTVFVEGLATGLAVYQSVRSCSVVVCFNAGNFTPVVQRMRPTGSVVFAADNDHGTLAKRGFNPGIEAATKAADLIGAGVVWPDDIEGTDWADFLKEHGAQSARRMERLILAKARYVSALDSEVAMSR